MASSGMDIVNDLSGIYTYNRKHRRKTGPEEPDLEGGNKMRAVSASMDQDQNLL
jgi:hypothetical protein